MDLNRIYNEDNLETCKRMPDGFVDLVVTSPPYDNLRTYNGFSWDFEALARELFRVVKKGGVVVWVVGDATVNGSETGTSFRQALYFKEIGFNLHDTMIWYKPNPTPTDPDCHRYYNGFEFMFILSSGKPRVCNYIKTRCVNAGKSFGSAPMRRENGTKRTDRDVKLSSVMVKEEKVRNNIWEYVIGSAVTKDTIAHSHPAIFPETLAKDHILSWSNEGDLVYDPFMGSGTTAKAAHQLNRRWIGSEISSEYVDLANKRLEPYLAQESLF